MMDIFQPGNIHHFSQDETNNLSVLQCIHITLLIEYQYFYGSKWANKYKDMKVGVEKN